LFFADNRTNFFVNAADAMDHGGQLVLKTSHATHDDIKSKQYHPAPGDYLRLTVSDTGIGMNKEVRIWVATKYTTG
jgi:two-component system cell cycle sensor histidine kinase/response regulator CckA